MEKSKKKFFSLDEVSKLMKQGEELKDAGPEAKQNALEMARYKLTPDAKLAELKARITGANPLDNDIIRVPGGTGGFIEDRSMVRGKIPVDPASIIPSSESTPQQMTGRIQGVTEKLQSPGMMKEMKGPEWTSKLEALKKLKGPGKKMLGMIGGPAIGAATALATGDVMAMAPEAFQAEEAGRGSDTQMASQMDRPGEGGYMSPERRKRLFNMLQDR